MHHSRHRSKRKHHTPVSRFRHYWNRVAMIFLFVGIFLNFSILGVSGVVIAILMFITGGFVANLIYKPQVKQIPAESSYPNLSNTSTPNYNSQSTPPPNYVPSSTNVTIQSYIYCPTCGTKNSGDALYCIECGSALKINEIDSPLK